MHDRKQSYCRNIRIWLPQVLACLNVPIITLLVHYIVFVNGKTVAKIEYNIVILKINSVMWNKSKNLLKWIKHLTRYNSLYYITLK